MSAAIIFTPLNTLEKILDSPDAQPADVLVGQAQARIDGLRDTVRAFVKAAMADIFRLTDAPEAAVFAECHILGKTALSICEVATAAGWPAVGEAARGTYEMVESLVQDGVWHIEALKIHVNALALLNSDPAPPQSVADQILARLRAMRERVAVQVN